MTRLNPDLYEACRAAYGGQPLSPVVWERIRPVWVPAYRAAVEAAAGVTADVTPLPSPRPAERRAA